MKSGEAELAFNVEVGKAPLMTKEGKRCELLLHTFVWETDDALGFVDGPVTDNVKMSTYRERGLSGRRLFG